MLSEAAAADFQWSCGDDVGCVCLQGLELCRVIAMQVENMMLVREKRLTLPPSEITML